MPGRVADLLLGACSALQGPDGFTPDLAYVLPTDDGAALAFAASLAPFSDCAPPSVGPSIDALETLRERLVADVDCDQLARVGGPPFGLGCNPDVGIGIHRDGSAAAILSRCLADPDGGENAEYATFYDEGEASVTPMPGDRARVTVDLQRSPPPPGSGTTSRLSGTFEAVSCPELPRPALP